MTDDIVSRLRNKYASVQDAAEAADRIEELNRAVLDLAHYVSNDDLYFYIKPETKKVLHEIGEKKHD